MKPLFPLRHGALALVFASTLAHGALAAPPVADTPFAQEYHDAYPLATPAENDVRALVLDDRARLWAATAAGVRLLEGGVWRTPEGGAAPGLTYTVCRDAAGVIWAGAWNGLYRVEADRLVPAGLAGEPISAIACGPNGALFAGGGTGIWRIERGGATKLRGTWQTSIRALLPTDDNRLWIGTASGLYLQDLVGDAPGSVRYSRPDVILSSNVNCLRRLADGGIAIGSTGGIDLYRGTRRLRSLSANVKIPCRQVRSVVADAQGRLWAATALGICRYNGAGWSLRHSRRWLQSDDARDVAIAPDGTAFVATAAGVDAIRARQMTLASKADYLLKNLRARHIRPPGFVGPAVLEKRGDLSRSFIEDDDNDGEHTGMYCAMESMRFAVTKDPQARENAKAAFHALLALQRATGTRHFIARSILPIDTPPRHEVDRTYTPVELAELRRTSPREKAIEKRWLPTADGKWLWKRDASSDEVDGHLFGYALYFDLAADEEEKRLVADQVDRIVGGIVDHGYKLVDIDGKATQWGDWSPESLNGDANWHEERPGNSVEILSHLGVAYHMTHNPRYLRAAQELVEKHGYARNMQDTRFDTPAERTHIEDELLSIVYPNLLTHLISPALRSAAQTSIRRWHETAGLDGIPFYDFVYNRYSGRTVALDRAVETLRDWPLDHIEWTVDSSRREDVVWDRTPGRDEGFLAKLPPRSEMGLCMWDQEPYRAVIGNGGEREDRQCDWLLAYWMGRYYGLLAAPK